MASDNMKQALPGKLAKLITIYAYVHIIIYQLCLKIEIWFTSDHQ